MKSHTGRRLVSCCFSLFVLIPFCSLAFTDDFVSERGRFTFLTRPTHQQQQYGVEKTVNFMSLCTSKVSPPFNFSYRKQTKQFVRSRQE